MTTNQSRRDFFKLSATSAIGLMLFGAAAACKSKLPIDRKSIGVGLQLYSVRDAIQADLLGSLQKIAALGYRNIEMASYSDGKFYGYAPAEFKKIINDLGMEIISSHAGVESTGITIENAQRMADAHAEVGVKYCIQPWVNDPDRNVETYKRMIADWNEVGRVMKNVGVQFGYHNHNFEFDNLDGIVPFFDLFMPEMDADLITFELDLYWATKAGQDPIALFKKYPGRFKLLHFKDMTQPVAEPYFHIAKDDIAPVGVGLIDFKQIWDAREIAGAQYFFVEDDNQGNGKPFEGIGTSIENITTKILK